MNKWNSTFVDTMRCYYKSYVESKDERTFRERLSQGLMSPNEFYKAFTAGLIEWLADKHFDMRNELIPVECVLKSPSYPSVKEGETLDEQIKETALPAFKKYNIYITQFV